MRNQTFIKNHTADAAIAAYRLVINGAADGNVAQAAGVAGSRVHRSGSSASSASAPSNPVASPRRSSSRTGWRSTDDSGCTVCKQRS